MSEPPPVAGFRVTKEMLDRIVDIRSSTNPEHHATGILINPERVVTTTQAIADLTSFDVVAGTSTVAAERFVRSRTMARLGIEILRLSGPGPRLPVLDRFGDAAEGETVLVVFKAGDSWDERPTRIVSEQTDRWILDDVVPEGRSWVGAPVFGGGSFVGIVTALRESGLEAVRLASITFDPSQNPDDWVGANERTSADDDDSHGAAGTTDDTDDNVATDTLRESAQHDGEEAGIDEDPAVQTADVEPHAPPQDVEQQTPEVELESPARSEPSPDEPAANLPNDDATPTDVADEGPATNVDSEGAASPLEEMTYSEGAQSALRWYDAVVTANTDGTTPIQALLAAFVLHAAGTTGTVASIVREHLRSLQRIRRRSDATVLRMLSVEVRPTEPAEMFDLRGHEELRPILLIAADIRRRTEPDNPIHLRHVLVSMLAEWPEDLREPLDRSALAQSTLSVLTRDAPALAEEWQAVFQSLDAIGEPSVDTVARAVARGRALAGMTVDAVDASTRLDDELQVERDVNTLCDVLAASDVAPPISVGLFGEWGSGKSYFMAMMRRRMKALAELAAAEEREHRVSAYCSDIQFIEFNAWHFVDANLWASLAVRLFEGMVHPGAGPPPGERAASLRAEIQQRESKLATVDRKVAKALADPRLGAAARELGSEDARTKALSLASETSKLLMFSKAIWQRLFGSKSKAGRLAFVLMVLFVAALITLSVYLLIGEDDTFGALLAGLPVLATLFGVLGRIVPRVIGALKQINAVLEATSLEPRDVTKERIRDDPDLVRLRMDLNEVEQEDSFVTHLLERANSEEYRRHFGLIAIVRKDLEELEKQLRAASKQRRIVLFIDDLDRCPPTRVVEVLQAVHLLLAFPLFVAVVGVDPRWLTRSLERHYRQILSTDHEGAEVEAGLPPAGTNPHDYLEKIFQIPFSLDPMSAGGYRSLIATLVAVPEPAAMAETGDGRAKAGPAPERPTQDDELGARPAGEAPPNGAPAEPRHEPRGEAEMTPTATPPVAAHQRGEPATATGALPLDGPERVAPEADASPAGATTNEAAVAVAPVASIDPNPQRLNVTDDEKAALSALGAMISTPRSAKRLVNIYRLIKARLPDDEVERFVEQGNYEIVAVLLGCLVGFPSGSRALFADIRERAQTSKARQSAMTFTKEFERRFARSDVKNELAPMIAALESVLEDRSIAAKRTAGDYAMWIRAVERYSLEGAFSTAHELPPEPRRRTREPAAAATSEV
jgi:hypothetical protein